MDINIERSWESRGEIRVQRGRKSLGRYIRARNRESSLFFPSPSVTSWHFKDMIEGEIFRIDMTPEVLKDDKIESSEQKNFLQGLAAISLLTSTFLS